MSMTSRLTTLLLVGMLTACDPLESSDSDHYDLTINLVDQLGLDSHRVLVGTTFTLSLGAAPGSGLACVETSSTGVVSKIGSESYSVDVAGQGTVELVVPDASCPYVPDRWSAIGVEAEATTALWVPTSDSLLMSARASPGPAGMFPEAIARPLDYARVAVDGQFALLPTLVDQSAGERAEVRWQKSDGVLSAPSEYTWPTTNTSYPSPVLGGRLRAGESLAPTITILDHELELPHVEAVQVDAVVELQLVAVYEPSHEAEREWGRPAGIIAIALDGAGLRVVGTPVEWSLARGDVDTGSEPYLGDDVLLLWDCADPPSVAEWRSAIVEAEIAGHVASVELEWLALPSDFKNTCEDNGANDGAEVDDGSGCDCSATAASPIGAAGWLLGLAARRRRRRRAAVD